MGLLDFFTSPTDPIAPVVPQPPDDGRSLFQRYLLPDDMSRGTSNSLNSALGAIGAGLLAGNSRQLINPQAFSASLEASSKDADRQQQRAALKLILKQANPSLSDAELEVMANDPATAKLAMSAAETQASAKAGQQASGILGGLFGGGDASGQLGAASGGAGGNATPFSGSQAERAKTIYDGVIARGGSPLLASAAVGNFTGESDLNPSIGGDKDRAGNPTSFGLGQWRGERLDALKALAAKQGKDWRDPDVQLDHMMAELGGGDAGAARANRLIQSAQSPQEAAAIFAKHFERPSDEAYASSLPKRAGAAAYAFGQFGNGPRSVQVADASGAMPAMPDAPGPAAMPRMPAVSSADPGFQQSGGPDPLAGFVPSAGPYSSARAVPPVGSGRTPPPPPAPEPLSGTRNAPGGVRVAESEQQVQELEGRLSQYPPNVYGATQTAQADMPVPNAENAEYFIPPGGGAAGGRVFGPETVTGRALAARQQGGGLPTTSDVMAPNFPLNDPRKAAQAIPKLMQVLAIPNLPDAQKAQAKVALDYALGVVKPTDRTRQLMEAGFTPGTPEYKRAYNSLLNSDRTPSGYRFTGDGQALEAIPGGPNDPANKGSKAAPTGYRAVDDGSRFEPIPGGPADPATITAQAAARASGRPAASVKPLPQNAVKALSEAGEGFGDLSRIAGSFQPDYAGWRIGKLGEAANQLARTTGIGNTSAADWWSDYAQKRNVVRNKLFGSALTSQEKAEFEKADITPGMTPDAIQKVLARQQAAATAAARKLAAYHVKTGRDPAEIEAAMGVGLDELGLQGSGGDSGPAAPRPPSGGQLNRPAFSPSDIEAEARRRGLIQ